jgi:TonB family protein
MKNKLIALFMAGLLTLGLVGWLAVFQVEPFLTGKHQIYRIYQIIPHPAAKEKHGLSTQQASNPKNNEGVTDQKNTSQVSGAESAQNSFQTDGAIATVESDSLTAGDILLLQDVRARYPDTARRAGIEAEVVIDFVINEAGLAQDAHVLNCTTKGYGFEENALAAIRQLSFKPVIHNGKTVKVKMRRQFKFKLEE